MLSQRQLRKLNILAMKVVKMKVTIWDDDKFTRPLRPMISNLSDDDPVPQQLISFQRLMTNMEFYSVINSIIRLITAQI